VATTTAAVEEAVLTAAFTLLTVLAVGHKHTHMTKYLSNRKRGYYYSAAWLLSD